jgi:hypothetical protein
LTVQTTSEILFEKFCADAKISCLPIPRSKEQNQKTPDYDLIFGAVKVVTEVKEIERNAEEKESDRLLELRGYGNATGGVPGQRVRLKIQSSSPQIKTRAQGIHPSLLVLFDGYSFGRHITPYDIRVAMYGLETFILAVPELGPPCLVGKKLGPRRKMTPKTNTSISAIATLHQLHTGEIKLLVYHNDYATIPLSPAVLAQNSIGQFRLGEAEPGGFPQWVVVI